ncbi:uncharacterized protein RJT20DRAFT_41 [Scheffersomyces xylosifermentans]|uniref:uncharacterized protein n=1 Tax=Scheffersomyces xylosifermentans TaxID=1304137 RepID=UPI00315D977E
MDSGTSKPVVSEDSPFGSLSSTQEFRSHFTSPSPPRSESDCAAKFFSYLDYWNSISEENTTTAFKAKKIAKGYPSTPSDLDRKLAHPRYSIAAIRDRVAQKPRLKLDFESRPQTKDNRVPFHFHVNLPIEEEQTESIHIILDPNQKEEYESRLRSLSNEEIKIILDELENAFENPKLQKDREFSSILFELKLDLQILLRIRKYARPITSSNGPSKKSVKGDGESIVVLTEQMYFYSIDSSYGSSSLDKSSWDS